jgi:hypothetical protein
VESGLERSEYEVLGRLVGAGSSSKAGSGAARFFPFGSRTGSLIVRGAEEEGRVERRMLDRGVNRVIHEISTQQRQLPFTVSGWRFVRYLFRFAFA